jgi:hypothetical protein
MQRNIVPVIAATWCLALFALPAVAVEKQASWADTPSPCDVYGPGYKAAGATGACVKIGGSVELDISSGQPPAASSTDWIKTTPAKNGK